MKFNEQRLKKVDKDFLDYEIQMISSKDKKMIEELLAKKERHHLRNPHNSLLLYVTDLSDQFDFDRARSDMQGGTPPDIDMDWDSLERDKLIDEIIKFWGRENVANILTVGTMKPKSLVKDFFRVTAPAEQTNEAGEVTNKKEIAEHFALQADILSKIPPALFGKEPTLQEVIEGSKEKGYEPHPELLEPKYAKWLRSARKLENMVKLFGIHAAGVVVSNSPISDTIPILRQVDKIKTASGEKIEEVKYATQWDLKDVEANGSIKFDFLGIDNLSIIKEVAKLIDEDIDVYNLPDNDEATAALLQSGLLTGLFQIETSASVKDIVRQVGPKNIEDISAISALHRPGPLSAGFHTQYIQNKNNAYQPHDMPDSVARILEKTHYVLIYQETVMSLCSELGGFTLQESDDIRRAMG